MICFLCLSRDEPWSWTVAKSSCSWMEKMWTQVCLCFLLALRVMEAINCFSCSSPYLYVCWRLGPLACDTAGWWWWWAQNLNVVDHSQETLRHWGRRILGGIFWPHPSPFPFTSWLPSSSQNTPGVALDTARATGPTEHSLELSSLRVKTNFFCFVS